MHSICSRKVCAALLGAAALLAGTVVYRVWLGNLVYLDGWQTLTREIDAASDIHDEQIQNLMKSVGDARFLGDLGVCYVLGDSLWIDGRNVSQAGVLYTFDVVNEDRKPVRIDEISTSCGCAKAAFPTRQLSPGEHAELALSISHEKLSDGPHNYWVTLTTDRGASWRYGVKVDIVRSASWDQSDVYFGNVSTSTAAHEATAVLRLIQPPFLNDMEFQGVHATSELVNTAILPPESSRQANGMTEHRIAVKLTLDAHAVPRDGQGSCRVTAAYAANGQKFEVSERVHWERMSAYTAVPSRLVLRSSEQAPGPIRVVVSHATRVPFRIVSVEVPTFLSQPPAKDLPATEHELEFDVDREKLPGKHDFGSVVVRTNMADDDTLMIPLVFLRVPN